MVVARGDGQGAVTEGRAAWGEWGGRIPGVVMVVVGGGGQGVPWRMGRGLSGGAVKWAVGLVGRGQTGGWAMGGVWKGEVWAIGSKFNGKHTQI